MYASNDVISYDGGFAKPQQTSSPRLLVTPEPSTMNAIRFTRTRSASLAIRLESGG